MLAAFLFLAAPPEAMDYTGRVEAVPPAGLSAVTGGPLAAVARVTVAFPVDERTFLALQRAGLAGPGKLAAAYGLADEDGFPHPAVLSGVAPSVDPKTGTVRFRVAGPDSRGLLLPGMSARVRLILPK